MGLVQNYNVVNTVLEVGLCQKQAYGTAEAQEMGSLEDHVATKKMQPSENQGRKVQDCGVGRV